MECEFYQNTLYGCIKFSNSNNQQKRRTVSSEIGQAVCRLEFVGHTSGRKFWASGLSL